MKIQKYIPMSIILMMCAVFITPSVFAVITPNPTRAALREIRQQEKITLRHEKADQEIVRRVSALNSFINRINAMKKLSTEQKTSLVSQLNTEITNLQSLKVKVDNDVDLTTLTTDKKSIVDSFRVYALFMPKISILAYADRILDVVNDIKTHNPTGDALVKTTDAQTQAQNAMNTVITLDPSGYPANKTQLVTARSMLKVANQDIKTAWTEMKAIKPTISPKASL